MPVSENWGRGIIGPNIVLDGLVVYHDIANPDSYPGLGDTINDLAPLQGPSTASLSQVGGGLSYNSTFPQSLTFISGSGVRASGSFRLTNFGPSCTAIVVASSPTPTWNPNSGEQDFLKGGALVAGGGSLSPQTTAYSGFLFDVFYNITNARNELWAVIKGSSGTDRQYWINLTGIDITRPHVYYLTYNESTSTVTIGYDTTFSSTTVLPTNRISSNLDLYYSWNDQPVSGYDSRYLNYNLYSCMIYNRSLSRIELIQTYHALKSRYGLL